MAYARGFQSTIIADVETTFGSNPGTKAPMLMPFVSTNVEGKQSQEENPTQRGTRHMAAPTRTKVDVSGQIVVPLDTKGIGFWFSRLFGAPTTTGTTNYTHVFAPSNSALKSFLFQKAFPDVPQYFVYNGCKIQKFSTEWGASGFTQATLDIVGATETAGSTKYETTTTDILGKFLVGSYCTIDENGSASTVITNGSIDIGLELDTDMYGPSGTRVEILDGRYNASGKITAFFNDTSLLTKAAAGTETSLTFKWVIDTNTSLEIAFPEVTFDRTSPGISGPLGVRMDIPWRAYLDNDSGNTSVKVTLKNNVSTYA